MKKLQSSVKILVLLCALSLPVAWSAAAEPAAPAGPRVFNSGVFVNRINSFDIKTGTAEVDLWYWVICDGDVPSLKNLELSNGKLEASGETITQHKDGKHYVSQRYIATARCRLDISSFPFDRQKIVLSFEDSELTSDNMVFSPDVANSGIDKTFEMNEWVLKGIDYNVSSHHYPSSFGYLDTPSGQGSDYSQFNVEITLDRRGGILQKLFKYFWAVVVSVIVGLFALLIRVCDLDARFGMAVGALFANVGCSFLLSDMLPESPGVSLAEWVSYISLGFIMVFLVESIISLAIFNSGREKLSRIIDYSVFGISAGFYIIMWLFI
jgi:hypothetical protein